LDDVSLAVAAGEFLTLLGPSGSGKTTLLRCVAGLEEPSAGEILIGERNVTQLSPAARDVALVFQHYALYPHLTARENLAFGLAVRGVAAAEIAARVAETAGRLGIGGALLDRRPAELSGGERQRVALGRAVVRRPRLLLLDEPLASLDAPLRSELRAELLALHGALAGGAGGGTTMIYVTQEPTEAMTLGQRMAVLHDGRLRQVGTPAQVYGRPADVFVARFVGNPGMNVLRGRGRGTEHGSSEVDFGGWTVPVSLERYEGDLYLGVRPEHVALSAPERGMGTLVVRAVELLGPETLVRLDAGGQPLVARVSGIPNIRPGDRVGVTLDRRQLHLFDAAGERLEAAGEPRA
jgi:multiple sugar transport system ATP-binding protein